MGRVRKVKGNATQMISIHNWSNLNLCTSLILMLIKQLTGKVLSTNLMHFQLHINSNYNKVSMQDLTHQKSKGLINQTTRDNQWGMEEFQCKALRNK